MEDEESPSWEGDRPQQGRRGTSDIPPTQEHRNPQLLHLPHPSEPEELRPRAAQQQGEPLLQPPLELTPHK